MLQAYIDRMNMDIMKKRSVCEVATKEPYRVHRCNLCGNWILSNEYYFEVRGTTLHRKCLPEYIGACKMDRSDGKGDDFKMIEVVEN